jgi:hypothetical protein
MNEYEKQCQAIAALLVAWGDPEMDATKAVKTLERVERSLHEAHERACNEPYDPRPTQRRAKLAIGKIFPRMPEAALHLNSDPRGYALKIDDEFMRSHKDHIGLGELQTDWGGYGILSPDLD